MSELTLFFANFFALFMESAPWLMLGLLIAGVMHELVPVSLLQKHMGDSSFGAVLKAAFIGAPLPLCSCGVIPAALGLRRSGASKPATVSFLVATPETGVDSVSVSYALLGPVFAIVRPIAAIISAIYAGTLVKWFAEPDTTTSHGTNKDDRSHGCCSSKQEQPVASSCCSSGDQQAPVKMEKQDNCCSTAPRTEPTSTSCCSTKAAETSTDCCSSKPVADKKPNKVAAILQFSTGKLLEDITVWLLVGLLLAAAIQTWVPVSFLTQWGDGLLAMVVMALIGVPMYICATASTPLAVGFLSAGLSPGAILVFLLAGPATNISTMGMIGREMGKRTLVLYIVSIMSASIGLGYLLNFAVDAFALAGLIPTGEGAHIHGESAEALYALCAVILGGLMIRNTWKAGLQKLADKQGRTQADAGCH